MKQRNQKGSLQKRKQGKRQMWVALWWEGDKRKFATIGQVSKMTKATAEQEMAKLVQPINIRPNIPTVAEYVNGVFLPFKRRAWKESTRDTTEQRLRTHLIADLGNRMVSDLKRDNMAEWLDEKAKKIVSKSLVAHLRWDLKAILDLAVADGIVPTNQAQELYIPRILKTVNKRAATPKDVLAALAALTDPGQTVRLPLIFRLAVYVGLRPGEIMGLKWEHVGDWSLQIQQRVYRGKVDASTKNNKPREVAIPKSVRNDLRRWREQCTESEWVFPSTTDGRRPGNKDSIWRHSLEPRLRKAGLEWFNFQAMRRTWATIARGAGVDPKISADQLGHGLGVDLNEYVQTDLALKRGAVDLVELALEGSATVQ